ncbi:MAG TPA: hypothetical protein QF564_08580 [Pirellulaceae bacterium]|nr:hypothetical protein [Pirellulaceae bacterium]
MALCILSFAVVNNTEVVLPNALKPFQRIVVDNLSTDVYAGEHGLIHLPNLIKQTSKPLEITVKGGIVTFEKPRVYELKPIWE